MNEAMRRGMACTWLGRIKAVRFSLMIPGGGGIALISHTSDKGRCSTKQQELVVKSLDSSSECGALMGNTVPLSNGASVCPANLTDGRDQRP